MVRLYKETFGTQNGKKVLFDLVKRSGFFAPAHVEGDPYSTHYNDGRRQVALYILKKLETDIDKLLALIKEGEKHEQELLNDYE